VCLYVWFAAAPRADRLSMRIFHTCSRGKSLLSAADSSFYILFSAGLACRMLLSSCVYEIQASKRGTAVGSEGVKIPA